MRTHRCVRAVSCGLLALGACAVVPRSAAAQPEIPVMTPTRVVLVFYNAVLRTEVEALSLMSVPLVAKVKQEGGVARFVADRSGGGQVRAVQVLKEQITGQTATVSYLLHLVDGTVKHVEDPLVNEGGRWKLTVKTPAKSPARKKT